MWERDVVSTGKLFMGMIQFYPRKIWSQTLSSRAVVVRERRERTKNPTTKREQLKEPSLLYRFSTWKTWTTVSKVSFIRTRFLLASSFSH